MWSESEVQRRKSERKVTWQKYKRKLERWHLYEIDIDGDRKEWMQEITSEVLTDGEDGSEVEEEIKSKTTAEPRCRQS